MNAYVEKVGRTITLFTLLLSFGCTRESNDVAAPVAVDYTVARKAMRARFEAENTIVGDDGPIRYMLVHDGNGSPFLSMTIDGTWWCMIGYMKQTQANAWQDYWRNATGDPNARIQLVNHVGTVVAETRASTSDVFLARECDGTSYEEWQLDRRSDVL